jgi:hypothetical protein
LIFLNSSLDIQGWSGDKQLAYPAMLAREILAKGIEVEALRNEIYLQLIKQLQLNPFPESRKKMWQLMQLCLKTFPPTNALESYLEGWLRSQGILKLFVLILLLGEEYWYTIRTLHKTQFRGVAKAPPTPEEITAETNRIYTAQRQSVMIRPTLRNQRTSIVRSKTKNSARTNWSFLVCT